jgi:hypothetical protein
MRHGNAAPMPPRRVIPAAVFAALIAAAPASAATEAAAGPSATPLILEVALAVIVMTGLAVRRPAARALAGARRRLTSAFRRRASVRAPAA